MEKKGSAKQRGVPHWLPKIFSLQSSKATLKMEKKGLVSNVEGSRIDEDVAVATK